ncbi:hypothetical protein KGM_216014A, partial [Danaus plexippus plexippus]
MKISNFSVELGYSFFKNM